MNETIIEYKGEKFTRTGYNGISVLIDSNGYYNASKICKDNKTKFLNISRNDYWTSYIDELSYLLKIEQVDLIRDRLDLSKELRGTYIHKKLVNWLCEHVNLKYAIKVGEIMDAIDEKIKAEKSSLEEEIEKLKRLAVPEHTNNKMLRIMKISDGRYKLSGDSTRANDALPYEVIKTFIFPASMNVRRDLVSKKKIKKFMFSDLDDIVSYIRKNYLVLDEF